jgi:hypothetical protein
MCDDIAYAIPEQVSGRSGKRLAKMSASSNRNVIIPIRDAEGIIRTAARRWSGQGEAPKPKSMSLPVALVGQGDDWGGVWTYGSIPGAVEAAAAGEPIYLVEGAPDYLAMVGLLAAENQPGAVVGFYSVQTAVKVATALVSKLAEHSIIAERIVIIPHRDEPEEGQEKGIGERTAEEIAERLRGRGGIYQASLPMNASDVSEMLKLEPDRALPILRVAKCVHERPIHLKDAPKEMSQRFRRAVIEASSRVSSGRQSLIIFKVPPGAGKSTEAIKTAASIVNGEITIPVNGKRPRGVLPHAWPPRERSVVFAVPNHPLAEDQIGALAELAPGTRAAHVRGLLHHCHYASNVKPVYESVGRRGVCGNEGDRDQRCPHADVCPGASDPKALRGEVTWVHHSLLGKISADLVIVDENPGVIRRIEVTAAQIQSLFNCRLIPRIMGWRRYKNPSAGDAAHKLSKICSALAMDHAAAVSSRREPAHDKRIFREELAAIIDADPELKTLLREGFAKDAPEPPVPFPAEARSGAHDINNMPSRPAFTALRFLAMDHASEELVDPTGLATTPPRPMCCICLKTNGSWTLEVRQGHPLPKGPVIILDATGDYTLAEWQAVYPDRRVAIRSMDVQGALPSRAIHVDSQSFSRKNIFDSGGALREEAGQRVIKVLELLASETRASRPPVDCDAKTRLGVLTHMPLIKAIEKDGNELNSHYKRMISRGFSFEGDSGDSLLGWFGLHDRGTNRFESVDGLVVIGDYAENLGNINADAAFMKLTPEAVAAGRMASACEQAITRARHIRRGPDDRVVLVFAGMRPPVIPGLVWERSPLSGGRVVDESSARVAEVLWQMAREHGVLAMPLLEIPAEGYDPTSVTIERKRKALDRVAKALNWRKFSISTASGRLIVASVSQERAFAWGVDYGLMPASSRSSEIGFRRG